MAQDAKEADTCLLPWPDNAWHPIARVAFRFAFVYFGLYIVTTQMFWGVLLPAADLNQLANLPPLRYAISWVAVHLFGVTAPLVIEGSGSGDKIFDWAHVCLLLAVATGVTVIWSILDRRRKSYRSLCGWFRIGVRLGLGTTMLSYGVAKAVPLQMGYGPSLTRLVEPFGSFSPMGVLWTFMGSSPSLSKLYGLHRNPRWHASSDSSNRPAGRTHLLRRLLPDLCPEHDLRRSGKASLFSPSASFLVP